MFKDERVLSGICSNCMQKTSSIGWKERTIEVWSASNLIKHLKRCRKKKENMKHRCKDCNKVFPTSSKLKVHTRNCKYKVHKITVCVGVKEIQKFVENILNLAIKDVIYYLTHWKVSKTPKDNLDL